MRIKATYFIPLLLTLVTSCSIDEKFGFQVEKGVPTTVSLNFDVAGRQVYTRAAQPSEDEYRVGNLYILVFDSEGRRLMVTDATGADKSFFYGTEGGLSFDNWTEDSQKATGSVNFNVPSGDVYVVGIANIKSDKTPDVLSGYDISVDDLSMDAIPDLASLKELIVNREDESVFRGKYFLMTGDLENVLISNAESASVESRNIANRTLMLRRVDAKVTVTMTSELPSTDASFEPKTWKVMRVPKQSLLLPAEGTDPWTETRDLDATGEAAEYFNMTEPLDFEEIKYKDDNDNTFYYNEGSFTFYMPENRKLFRKEITETDPTKAYAAREAGLTSEDFTYANPNSTYLEMNGYISYTDTDGSVVNADVTFTVHLGYASRNANDYDTKRNGHYRYTIKVKGIKDISTEVEHSESDYEGDRPGYQGDVIINSSSAQIYNLDAHYETRLLKIPVDHTFDFKNMTWSIMTPFCSGVYRNDDDISEITDYEWIKFAINAKHGGTDPSKFVKFPGIKDTHGNEHYNSSWTPEIIDSKDYPLMNIKQLLDYIRYKNTRTELSGLLIDGEICITAFIDEYYYNDHSWKDFVNTYDRQMHIITDGVKYSPDGHSAVASASYSFVQRSIRSIYNTEASGLTTGWGVETLTEPVNIGPNEEKYADALQNGDNRLDPGAPLIAGLGSGSDRRNGRSNTWTLWQGKDLDNIIDYSNQTIKPDNDNYYRNAVYACMLRNRDENGNGTIDDNELKWYLAAIDQLVDLYIGEGALNKDSRLYPYDPANGDYPPGDRIFWHYVSSSANGDQPWVLWAEEGASIGSYKNDDESSDALKDSESLVDDRYSFRCIRNLGIPDDDYTIPADFVGEPNDKGNYVYEFDLSALHPNARRLINDRKQIIGPHNEKDEINRPFERFEVTGENYGWSSNEGTTDIYREAQLTNPGWGFLHINQFEEANYEWINQKNWTFYNANNPCPNGYRLPNQRELLIISTRLNNDQWQSYEISVRYWKREPFSNPTEHIREYPNQRPECYFISRTAFSMNGAQFSKDGNYKIDNSNKYQDRDGFLWNYGSKNFSLQNNDSEVGYVRCVKDTN